MCGSEGIIPAYAGSTYERVVKEAEGWDHPRIRGEHGWRRSRGGGVRGSSPHTRGARLRLPDLDPRRRIIPAYAGSTTGSAAPETSGADHPRIRGEHLRVGVDLLGG